MEDIDKIAKRNGYVGVLRKLSEECAELIQVSQKMQVAYEELAYNVDVEKHLCEEIADVEIMIRQLKNYIYGEKIEEIKKQKIARQLERMKLK